MRNRLLRWPRSRRALADPGRGDSTEYATRLASERDVYTEREVVHDLPPIFHLWSREYLLPMLEAVGVTTVNALFADALEAAYRERRGGSRARFVSIGAGNCDAEVAIAQTLLARGCDDFVIECLELNATMLERGELDAAQASVASYIRGVQGDFNTWQPEAVYDGVLANQSLHHVLNLEDLFASIEASLSPTGRFVTSDMIGRNGHMRWPEARRVVDEFWQELPHEYRFHHTLHRHEAEFIDWDCSTEGFEGIRAQDVLPLLVERFEFELFLGFGNVIDVFVDRGFGPNFDPDAAWDQDFIRRVHERDMRGLVSGELKPTHVMAVMRNVPTGGAPLIWGPLTPAHCMRQPTG